MVVHARKNIGFSGYLTLLRLGQPRSGIWATRPHAGCHDYGCPRQGGCVRHGGSKERDYPFGTGNRRTAERIEAYQQEVAERLKTDKYAYARLIIKFFLNVTLIQINELFDLVIDMKVMLNNNHD